VAAWISSAIRESGLRDHEDDQHHGMMSIIGITLGSDTILPSLRWTLHISSFLLLRAPRKTWQPWLGDSRHYAGAGLPGDLHSLLDFRELQLIVRLK
jgi:hypothetical protein